MTRTVKILLFLLVLLLPISALSASVNKGDFLEPFTALDMNGSMVNMNDIIGKKPVMLIFWASWCPSCKAEVPKVNALVKKYRPRGMEFIGINIASNDSVTRTRRFMEKTGITYPIIFDEQKTISRQYGIQGVPTVLVADRRGIIQFRDYGVPEITEKIFMLLKR